jgi:glycosyltransferase involved in cell wall biosynthesis
MRVLCLTSFPKEAAATRFRVEQFIGPLASRGVDLTLSPFLDSKAFSTFYNSSSYQIPFRIIGPLFNRIGEVLRAQKYDLLFVQREAMFFGPEIFERLIAAAGKLPIVLDLDDATYVRYVSPRFGRLASLVKCFGKTDRLIRKAAVVTCGNRFIAEYVASLGTKAEVIPTVVDTDVFSPVEKNNVPLIIGWIGTHSTFPSLERLFPVLRRLAEKFQFKLKIVGAGREEINLPGVIVENLKWSLDREPEDFRSLDIGLYPIFPAPHAGEDWIRGKSGFKAIQYMSVGVPFVMSPVGICAEIGTAGETHLEATSLEQWYNALEKLLSDADLRKKIGASGRQKSLEFYTVPIQAEILAKVFHRVVSF